MKASHALLATTVFGQDTYNYNFGLNAVDCGKLNYNLRTQNKTEHKSQPKKDVFFPYYL